MKIFRKISNKIKYRKIHIDPNNALDYITLNISTKPTVTINIHIPKMNGSVNVYTVDASTITPNSIYTDWSLEAKYNFTYKPSKNKYNKLINLNI